MPKRNMTLLTGCRKIYPMLIGLMLCVAGCSPRVETVVLTPPESLMQPTPHPELPEALMRTDNLREYSKAATLAIARYSEALDKSNADKAGISAWCKAVESHDRPR